MILREVVLWNFSAPSLWAKPNGDNEWFKEIRHVPPEDNKDGSIPVSARFQPLRVGSKFEPKDASS
jgi:hypothetical protein